MSRLSFGSPLRPKFQTARRFLSLQVSQASHVLSDELSNILKSSKTCGKKRRRIIDEIFSTEQSYQEHLHMVTSLFLSPLREMSLLPDHVLNVIFSNIEAIQNVNRELLVHMETMGIGDAFLALAPFLKLYSTYANNFEKALNTIKDWEKKCPKFAAFKEQQENLEEAKGLKLNALLITPIQRVPRYKMLLENLLWKTQDEHADFTKLQEAVDQISKVALHINENIRQHENFQKMLSIQNSFCREGAPKLLAPGRVFIKEGTLLKRGWRSAKERTFFLFSDILIYAKKNNEKDSNRPFLCLQVFPLQQCEVHEVMGDGNTSEGGALFSAVDQISKVALHINENIRQHENFQKMLSIQNSFCREGAPKLLAPGRVFIKEGTLLKRGWRSAKERTFFLFSDILIYAKKNNEKDSNRPFLCLQVFPLQQCEVHEVMGDGNTSEGGALFSIECQEKTLLLFSKSQGEAKSWLNEIRKMIECARDSGATVQATRRPACNNSKRAIRRAPAKKTNERKRDSSQNLGSPVKNAQYPFGCLSPNKECSLDDDKPSQSVQGKNDELNKIDDTYEENPKLIASSETSSLSSSLGQDDKENNTRGHISQGATGEDQIAAMSEDQIRGKDRISGVKRKLSESDISNPILASSNAKKRKSARRGGWLFTCSGNFEKIS